MKRTIINLLLAVSAVSFSLTGCIQETFPLENKATYEQLARSSAGIEGTLDGMIAQLYQPYYFYGDDNQLEFDISYAGLLVTYARMTNDFVNNCPTIGYDWWTGYCGSFGYVMNADNSRQTVPFMTLYKIIKTANNIIGPLVSLEELNSEQKHFLGQAYVYRALMYHDLYNMYLPAPNKYTDISAVEGLTVPIVLSGSEEETEYKTARAPKEALSALILSDLDKAEELLADYENESDKNPKISVVYGLKARMYLTLADYENAAKFAREAIDASGKTPMTEAQWHDPKKAFCDHSGSNSWMWYYQIDPENMGNLCNPTGFLGGEADWGYNSLTQLSIHRWMYDRLNRSDFRKKSFIDPDRKKYPSSYYKWAVNKEGKAYLSKYPFDELPDYFCIKIRCKNGEWTDHKEGGAVDWPMMRVEEMYLIEAEAVGMSQGENAGIQKLESFMKQYRDPEYSYAKAAASFGEGFVKSFQEEVLFQKRVEFLGEGVGFFDAKRIRPGMKTWYAGSNVRHDTMKYDIEEVSPYWNFVIPTREVENNDFIIVQDGVSTSIDGVMTTPNNPDPTGRITNVTTKY